MQKLIFPGSFDPITIGHLDIIKRASKTCSDSEIFVIVANNADKKHMFSPEERLKMVKKAIKKIGTTNVTAVLFGGTISDYIKDNNITVVVRAIRNYTDFEYEKNIELFTRKTTGIETIYFTTEPSHSSISSSAVRTFINKGFIDEIKDLVPNSTFKFVKKHINHNKSEIVENDNSYIKNGATIPKNFMDKEVDLETAQKLFDGEPVLFHGLRNNQNRLFDATVRLVNGSLKMDFN